jgi:hypothetical protein
MPEKYQERIATPSLDRAKVDEWVTRRRIAERMNMAKRAKQIEDGLRHLTPSMEEDMRSKGEL